MKKKYIAVDIESSGQYPWSSSMISIGACVVDGKFDKTFYAELKPITDKYIYENFKIGASSLDCLEGELFSPENALKVLKEKGEKPEIIMPHFTEWILENTQGYTPIIAAAPIKFDGVFVSYYMDKFNNSYDPFGYSGEDINSIFRGSVKDIHASIKELSMRPNGELRHNALEDAVQEGKELWVSLVNMRQHRF
ncbi:hypothetical protein HOD29_03510 [archaeon]|jgi:DNA polymerase III epsilon subunit-like protein|nr:hypothetical protein [archaeon]